MQAYLNRMEIVMLRVAVFLVACSPSIACACNEQLWQDPTLVKAQSELHDAYDLAWNGTEQKELLEIAQEAWAHYRQANCELMSDRDGTPAPEPQAQCLVFMAKERTLELRLLSPR
jgi:uncharacterized protein YecT (DUF1311 family)